LHTVAPAELAELAKTDPAVLVVNDDDMARALASALA
jgi:predicted dinucleotide-binding enzyme